MLVLRLDDGIAIKRLRVTSTWQKLIFFFMRKFDQLP